MNSNSKRKLENLAKFIEKLPRKFFNIDYWARQIKKNNDNPEFDAVITKKDFLKQGSHCKTQCCIAGWQLVRKGFGVNYDGEVFDGEEDTGREASDLAAEQLGIDDQEADVLFYPDIRYKNTPKGAAKKIRDFIKESK